MGKAMIERWLACAGVLSGLLVGGACDPRRPVDAGLDGGFDAGDGGSDAGRGDAGTDGGPDDPVWQTWLRLSDVCQIERATYPERLTPIEWRPCPDQPTGCLEQASGEGGTTTAYFDTARGRGYLVQSYYETHRRGPTIIALAPTGGPVLAAWRVPTYLARPTNWYCALSVELGAGDAVLMVTMENYLLSGQDRFEIYRAPLEEIGDVSEPLAELYARIPRPTIVVSSDLVVLLETFGDVLAIDNTGRLEWLRAPSLGGYPALPEQLAVAGPHVLWGMVRYEDPVRLYHAEIDLSAMVFRGIDGDVLGFQTDGVEMVWVEGYETVVEADTDRRTYARLELWGAPYVRDPVLLEPRRIRVLSGRSTRGTLGGGWYAIGSGVINTTDGTLWSTGRRGSILYVSEQEMLLDGADGLIRIDPSTFTLAE